MAMHPHDADNGYVIIKLIIPLTSRLIGDHPTSWRCFISRHAVGPYAYNAGRNREDSPEFDIGSLDWRNGEFLVRLLEYQRPEIGAVSAKSDLELAASRWKQRVEKGSYDLLRKLSKGRVVTAVEVLCPRGILFDCTECVNAAINQATRAGIAIASDFQIADSWATHHPTDLPTMESVRPFLWIGLEYFTLEGNRVESSRVWPVMTWPMLHGIPESPPPVTEQTHEEVERALRETSRDHLLGRFIELIVMARGDVYVRGSYEQGVMSAAQACEYLLDITLLFMMWREGMRPKDAASEFRRADNLIVTRVKECFRPRLGTEWDPASRQLLRWKEDVADVRNRVIHGGSLVTSDEATRALEATEMLFSYCIDAISSTSVNYSPLHEVLSGPADAFYHHPGDPRQRFMGWIGTFRVELGIAPKPSVDRSDVLLVPIRNGGYEWWLYDSDTHKVALANPRTINQELRREMEARAVDGMEQGTRRQYCRYSIEPRPEIAVNSRWINASATGPGLPIDHPF